MNLDEVLQVFVSGRCCVHTRAAKPVTRMKMLILDRKTRLSRSCGSTGFNKDSGAKVSSKWLDGFRAGRSCCSFQSHVSVCNCCSKSKPQPRTIG